MDKLLIVDDEEIERESMAQFIDWPRYGIELVGTAWNGVEALDFIERKRPDIVLTDIKMPVMNGIELISKTKALFPETEFIVLSGYGDYAYTSEAMEQGVRHYILKPCDEEKVVEVIAKVRTALEEKRRASQQTLEYERTIDRLMPRAAAQILCSVLLGHGETDSGWLRLQDQLGGGEREVRLLTIRRENGFDYLEQYAVQNMLADLLPAESVLLSATLGRYLAVLLAPCTDEALGWTADRVRQEFRRFAPDALRFAASGTGSLAAVRSLYEETQLLLHTASCAEHGVLLRGTARLAGGSAAAAFDPAALRSVGSYEQLLFELTLTFLKLDVRSADMEARREAGVLALLNLGQTDIPVAIRTAADSTQLQAALREVLTACLHIPAPTGREEAAFRQLLESCFARIGLAELSLSYLAHEVFYQSERNLGRLFTREANERFSVWLERTRIRLAQRLLDYEPNLRVGTLAESLGYMPDGQYFAKAFRKQVGCPPSEYRDSHLKKADTAAEKNGQLHA